MKAELIAQYLAVRQATETLAAPLSAEDQVLQSMPHASPTKWHRAHTTWFFETFVLEPRGVPPVHASYAYLFNSYYEALGARHERPKRGILSRPSCDDIATYRKIVDERIVQLLEGIDQDEPLTSLILLGMAHEEQHQELLLTDILHAFSQNPLRPAYRTQAGCTQSSVHSTAEVSFVEFAGGLVHLGHLAEPAVGSPRSFTFDNEGPQHRVFLEPFAIANRPINNDEVRSFIEAGGYQTASLWLSAGYERVQMGGITAPLYTTYPSHSLQLFTLDGLVEADPAAPAAHLDYYEADAICRFLGGRLPTEAEWEHVAQPFDPTVGNFRESLAYRPRATSSSEPKPVRQLFGDVWEWTSSAYGPYPGFAPAAGAVGEYNGKFMVNQMVLRGGSAFTPQGHVRASYRNFWPADTGFQLTGARVAQSR